MSNVTRLPNASDPFARLRAATPARIGLGRSGDALPTQALLEFQLAHAQARDAVHGSVDFDRLAAQLAPRETVTVHSRAADRAEYLRRPDLGRRLDGDSRARLEALRRSEGWDLAVVIADGLSSAAVEAQAEPLVARLLPRLTDWSVAPLVLAGQGRVALGDDIGEALGARLSLVLIGERPGLSVADSLGVYMTWAPRPGRRDSERNCLSNIHAEGQSHDEAAAKLAWLMMEARRRGLSGVALKDEGLPAGLSGDAVPTLSGPAEDRPGGASV